LKSIICLSLIDFFQTNYCYLPIIAFH